MQVWLYIGDQSTGEQRVMPLPETGVTIGRADGCDVRTEAPNVSRRHATISLQNGVWIITDNQSSGGTFVNDQRVTQAPLRSGDIIRCGAITLRMFEPNAQPQSPSSSSLRETPAQPPFRSQTKGYIWTDGCEPGPDNIDRLLVFLPIFEDTSRSFFEPSGHGYQRFIFSPEVHRFIQLAAEQGLICESNAVKWLTYKAFMYRDPAAIASADLYTCQRLLTAFVDDDPQCAIKLHEALFSGLVVAVLYRLRAIRDEMRSGQRRTLEDGRLQLILADIAKLGVDAIACSSDNTLGGTGKLERWLRERAGPELAAACERTGSCPEGEARLFPGSRLPAAGVLFTNPTDFRSGKEGEEAILVRSIDSCLNLAAQNGLHTVAFPSLGTGALHFPPKRAAELLVATARRYLTNNPKGPIWKVYFTAIDDAMYRAFEAAIRAPSIQLPDAQPKSSMSIPNSGQAVGTPSKGVSQLSGVQPVVTADAAQPITLPNPEARPIAGFLKHEFLINNLFSQLTLEAYRLSRTLINDPASKLETLDRMVNEWLRAHAGGPAAELKQLSRWDGGKLDGPQPLRDLCDRMSILAHGALGWQQPSSLYGFRVFLRALRDAFFVQAKLFGFEHKLSQSPGVVSNPHKPKSRELPDAWASIYRGSIVSHRAARVADQELTSFPSSRESRPLSLNDPALHLSIVRNLSIGAATLAGGGEDYFLITGYMGSLDRYYQLRVHTGTTEMVARDRYYSGSLPIDYVLVPDSDHHPDVSRYDLSPSHPETAGG